MVNVWFSFYSLFQYSYNQNLKRKKESWQVSKGLRKCSSLYIYTKKVVVIRGWVCYRVVNRPYVQEGKTTTKKYAFYQLTWVIAKNRLKFLYSLFHFTDLKKTIFLVTKSRTLQICLACNCIYNRFCKVKCVQSTPHNSKLLGKSKKVWIIRSSKQMTGIRK